MAFRKFRSACRRVFYRNPVVRVLSGCACSLSPSRRVGTLHLATYDEDTAMGPLQRDEALLLLGVTRTIAPRTVVEFGFFKGHSAFSFLQAIDDDALLASYDVDNGAARQARRSFGGRKNFRFLHKSQTDFDPADIDNRPIDLVFFDAAHEIDLNQATWRQLLPALAPDAIVAIHDTGLWGREHFLPIHEKFAANEPGAWVDSERFAHQPGEREFVNWLLSSYPNFAALHFHTTRRLRHGLTLLQRRQVLEAGPQACAA